MQYPKTLHLLKTINLPTDKFPLRFYTPLAEAGFTHSQTRLD